MNSRISLSSSLNFLSLLFITRSATSSAESESDGIYEAWKFAKTINNWSQHLSKALGLEQLLTLPIPIFNDSQAAIAILSKYINTSRVKHFDIKVFAVRDDYTCNFVDLIHITRDKNIADILTHRCTREMLEHFCNFVYVIVDVESE